MVESKLTIALWASAYLVQSRSASKYLQSNILQSWGIIFQSELCPNLHHSIKWSRTKSFFVVCRSLSGGAFGVILLTRSGECRNTGLGVISELRPNLKKLILIALLRKKVEMEIVVVVILFHTTRSTVPLILIMDVYFLVFKCLFIIKRKQAKITDSPNYTLLIFWISVWFLKNINIILSLLSSLSLYCSTGHEISPSSSYSLGSVAASRKLSLCEYQ